MQPLAPWDVVVIGGGPAGMMAAGRAAERGARVLLIEKNASLGKKLLITGGGRCNVTNAEFDVRTFLLKFKKSDQFLFSAFSQYAVRDALDFFHARNMPTKVEAELRVFPVSNTAVSVWDVLVRYMKNGNVKVVCESPVVGFAKDGNQIVSVKLADGTEIMGKSFILATGGKSRPETGSTGDGFKWLSKIGHTVVDQGSALVPIAIKDAWVKRLQGVGISNVRLTILQNGVRQDVRNGRILFTHFGISGPMVLNASRDIGELLKYGPVAVSLDLFPTLDPGSLDRKIISLFEANNNKQFKNILSKLVPPAAAPVFIDLSGIRPETYVNSVTRAERERLVKLLKNVSMEVSHLLGIEKAIITSGGVDLTEVDFKTMQSRLFPNLYLVGDMLNIDRPSGGYSLQLCWTTGYVAGTHAAGKAV